MFGQKSEKRYDRQDVLNDVIKILEKVSSGWESQFEESIGPETLLGGDLAFKSIDIARSVAAIRDLYSQYEFPYQELFMPDDRPVQDLSVSDLVAFLHRHLNRSSSK